MLIRRKSTGEAVPFAIQIEVKLLNPATSEAVTPADLAAPFDVDELRLEALTDEEWALLRLAGCPIPADREAPAVAENDDHFGGCPLCGRNDGYLNVGRHHYFVCDAHRVAWYAGSNLFSCWREESPDLHRANAVKLAGFRFVGRGQR